MAGSDEEMVTITRRVFVESTPQGSKRPTRSLVAAPGTVVTRKQAEEWGVSADDMSPDTSPDARLRAARGEAVRRAEPTDKDLPLDTGEAELRSGRKTRASGRKAVEGPDRDKAVKPGSNKSKSKSKDEDE